MVFLIGLVGFFVMKALSSPIAHIFSISRGGYDPSFHQTICDIFHYELLGCLLLSFAYSSFAFLLGLGRTKALLAINFARIFLFRLPVIYYFKNFTEMGYEAVGYTMAISNSLVGILAFIASEVIIVKERKRIERKGKTV